MKEVPSRLTYSYTNNHRPWELFRSIFYYRTSNVIHLRQSLSSDKYFLFWRDAVPSVLYLRRIFLQFGTVDNTDNRKYIITTNKYNCVYDISGNLRQKIENGTIIKRYYYSYILCRIEGCNALANDKKISWYYQCPLENLSPDELKKEKEYRKEKGLPELKYNQNYAVC